MADLIFPCPQCDNNLVVDEQYAGASVNCPLCNNTKITVPVAERSICCPACKNELRAPGCMCSKRINCPQCNQAFDVSPHLVCVGCKKTLDDEALLCVHCGTDQRSGNTLATTISSKSKLCLRQDAQPHDQDAAADTSSAVVNGPNSPQPTSNDRVLPLLKAAALLSVVAAAVLYIVINDKTMHAHEDATTIAKNEKIADSNHVAMVVTQVAAATNSVVLIATKLPVLSLIPDTSRQASNSALQTRVHQTPLSQRQEYDLAALRKLLTDKQTIGLFDAIIHACAKNNTRLSIDPDALGALAAARVPVASLSAVTNGVALGSFLSKYRLIVKHVPLSQENTNRVFYVTTDSAWTYSQACWYLANGQTDKAQSVLVGTQLDNTPFGIHCQSLQALLQRSTTQREQMNLHVALLRSAVQKMESALRHAKSAANAPTLGAWMSSRRYGHEREVGSSDAARLVKKAAVERHLDDEEQRLAEARTSWRSYLTTLDSNNASIWNRIDEAYAEGFYSEAYYWLNYLITNFDTLRAVTQELKGKGLLDADSTVGEMHPDITAIRDKWRSSLLCSRTEIAAFSGKGYDCNAKDTAALNETFLRDKANIYARINVGYHTVSRHTTAINTILRSSPLTNDGQIDIVRGLRDKHKQSYLQAAVNLVNSPVPFVPQESGVGSRTIGLAVVAAHGDLLPLSTKLVPNKAQLVTHQVAVSNYWGSYVAKYETLMKAYPITFGDYGEKDILMLTSAIEVYKWLCNTFPTNMTDKGLHIEFQALFANKGGPSAGVTMAVSAYSSLMGKPVLKNVAMTGEVRSDGSVHPIGGAHLKISGACGSDGIETVLVPKENAPDLLFVPLDELCSISIVEGSELMTFINASTVSEFSKHELEDLRKAQLLIRFGRFKDAEPLLLKVVSINPDIYSAKRLLELLSCYGKLDREPEG
jgi:hypothetical protein